MLEVLLQYSDEALLLLAGSGGTILWNEIASRRDTPIHIDVAVKSVSFGWKPLDVKNWEGFLSASELERISENFKNFDDIVFDQEFERDINAISARSGAVSSCIAQLYSGSEIDEFFGISYQNYGRFGRHSKAALSFERAFSSAKEGDKDEFLKLCNTVLHGYTAFNGFINSLLVSLSRGEIRLEGLLKERQKEVIEIMMPLVSGSFGEEDLRNFNEKVENGYPRFLISSSNDGESSLVIPFGGWAVSLSLGNLFREQRMKVAIQIYSLFATGATKELAEFFRKASHQFDQERRNIEEAVGRFNDLLARSIPSKFRVRVLVFNSAKSAVTLSPHATISVLDKRFPKLTLKFDEEASRNGIKLSSRDNLSADFVAEISQEIRDDLFSLLKGGGSECQVSIAALTRKGTKTVRSGSVAFAAPTLGR